MSSSPIPAPPPVASSTQTGLISTITQAFSGFKNWINGVSVDDKLVKVAHAQVLGAISDTISIPGPRLHLSGATNLKLTSTPTITAGTVVGQEIQIVNDGTKVIQLQNGKVTGFQGATLTGSLLDLRTRVVALAPGCSVTVAWNGSVWVETARATYGGYEVNVKDFGAVGDDTHDDYQAFRDAIDSFSAPGAAYGGRLIVPRGKYRVSQAISVDKCLTMIGESGGLSDPATVIRPVPGVSGIIVERYSSSESGGAGDTSVFEHIAVHHVDKTGGVDVHSWEVKATATFRNCVAWGAPGDGFHTYGSLPLAPDLVHYDGCFALENDLNGFAFRGGDSNAGICIRCSAIGNGLYGFYDRSFLGNTFIACHTDSNGVYGGAGGPYITTETTAQSIYIGCYAEENQNPGSLSTNAMAIGGLCGWNPPGIDAITGGGYHFAGYLSRWMKFQNDNRQGSAGGIMTVGGASRSGEFLNWTNDEDTADVAFNFGATTTAGFDGHYAFNYGHVDFNYLMLAAKYGQAPDGRSTGPGGLVLPGEVYKGVFGSLGQTPQRAIRTVAINGTPGFGTWEQGDTGTNSSPVAAGNCGWVCLTPGTFGTYTEGLTATCTGAYHLTLSGTTGVLTAGKWVRINGTDARIQVLPPWRRETSYTVNQKVFNGSSVYRCITAGLTSVASPPTGTGSDISDGNGIDPPVHWEYIGVTGLILSLSVPISGGAGLPISFVAPTFDAVGHVPNAAGEIVLSGGTQIDSRLIRVVHTQTLTAASDVITTSGSRLHLTSTSSLTLTSTPTITAGTVAGQEIQIVNAGTNLIILQGANTAGGQPAALSGSTLHLKSREVSLAPKCSITVTWDGAYWNEVHRATYGGTDVNILDYGATGDGTTDDYLAFRRAIDSFSAAGDTYTGGGTIIVPGGSYRISQSIRVDKHIVLRGAGGSYSNPSSVIKPDPGVTGIIIERYSSSEFGGAGDTSTIENLAVYPNVKSGTAHGFHLKSPATLRNCFANNCSGNGFHIVGSLPLAPDLWHLDECMSQNNDGDGYFIMGGDANAGIAIRCSASTNTGWGFRDSSFLGNTFVACHTDANVTGPYTVTQTTAQSLLLGCYAEENQPPSSIATNAMVLGGLHGSGFDGDVGGGGWKYFGNICRYMLFATTTTSGSPNAVVRIGGNGSSGGGTGEFFNFNVGDDDGSILEFNYCNTATSGGYNGNWVWNVNHTNNNPLLIAARSGETPDHRPLEAGSLVFPRGYYVGDDSQQARKVVMGSAAPAAGSWEQGDEIKNYAPVIDGNMGWVCLTPGTFGSYVEGLTATSTGSDYHFILSGASSVLVPGMWVTVEGQLLRINRVPPWRKGTPAQFNDHCHNSSGQVYKCTIAGATEFGTSATGPTGTGGAVVDGSVTWSYLGTSDVVLATSNVVTTIGSGKVLAFVAPTFGQYGLIY